MKHIAEFISNDSIYYAQKQINKFYESVEVLYEHPKIGRSVPEYHSDDLRQILVGRYRVIYKIINETRIDIITIHHSARILNLDL